MNAFELKQPQSLAEAISYLDPDDPSVRPIAGGSALLLMMKAGVFQPTRLVSLRKIESRYSTIEAAADGTLQIGALTTLSALHRAKPVQQLVPVIAETLRTLSNVRVRNVATLGGHLAHADPHMDLPPVLIALGAEVRTAGPANARSMLVGDLFVSYLETALDSNELLSEIVVPPQQGRNTAYLKCTTRSADDWPTLGVAVSLATDGDRVIEPRVVLGAATECPTRLQLAERELDGARIDAALLHRIGDAAAEEVSLLPDAHGSTAYKRQLVRVYVGRALAKALGSAVDVGAADGAS